MHFSLHCFKAHNVAKVKKMLPQIICNIELLDIPSDFPSKQHFLKQSYCVLNDIKNTMHCGASHVKRGANKLKAIHEMGSVKNALVHASLPYSALL